MNDLTIDIAIGILFITGIWVFISGQFIMSTVIFATAALVSNIIMRRKMNF